MSGPVAQPVLLDLPAEIRTPRLVLRPPRAGDGPSVFEAIEESLPSLRSFLASLPWVAGEQSVDNSEAWCRNASANFITRKDMPFLVFEHDGRLVGATGLHRIDWQVPKVEIGYWCRTSRTGRGFVTEAVEAIARFAFDRLHALRLEIVCDEANAASRRVAERCGFTLEGLQRHQRRAPDGTLCNTCLYARLAGR